MQEMGGDWITCPCPAQFPPSSSATLATSAWILPCSNLPTIPLAYLAHGCFLLEALTLSAGLCAAVCGQAAGPSHGWRKKGLPTCTHLAGSIAKQRSIYLPSTFIHTCLTFIAFHTGRFTPRRTRTCCVLPRTRAYTTACTRYTHALFALQFTDLPT